MKWTKRTRTIILAVLVLLLFACVFLVYRTVSPKEKTVEHFPQAAPKADETVGETAAQPCSDTETAENSLEEVEPYQSPVDFQSLIETNPDIYAWLDIPGTDISYPLLQHTGNDTFYLTHDAEGADDKKGALFTEETYNSRTFTDPVTVVYGHWTKSGLMFGKLQESYTGSENLSEHNEIVIYLPDRELHFKAFAAVPYDNRHILYNYDFTDKRTFRLFFEDILSVRAIEASFSDDAMVQSDEQVLILSTCLIGDWSKRFLVCAKLSK